MKKTIFLLVLFLLLGNGAYADSDYLNDYTLIDCVSGDNNTGIAFDSSKPFATLKSGIENTINYINININKAGNQEEALGKTFNIKVKCSFDDIYNQTINLNYSGFDYKNTLIIEGIDDNSLIFKNVNFQLGYRAGNIVFKNAQFLNENKAYFNEYLDTFEEQKIHPFTYGVSIQDSYILLKNGNNIGAHEIYKLFDYKSGNRYTGIFTHYKDYYNDFKNIKIKNSVIDVEVKDNYYFNMPTLLKDSKLNFINTSTGVFDISFWEVGNTNRNIEYNFSDLISNEINLGGNNFKTQDSTKISFLNNKFYNFNNFDFSGQAIFINNYIDNITLLDISKFSNLFNNIFGGLIINNNDLNNNRKNFSKDNIYGGGLGWIFKRSRDIDFFNLNTNISLIYKEVTGQDLNTGLGNIYVIFNY